MTVARDPDAGTPASPSEAQSRIRAFTAAIVEEALTVNALVDTLKGAKKFIEQAAREYAERFLFELIQNAYDAHPAGSRGRVLVRLDIDEGDHGTLYVANTGAPFTARDFRAICEIAQSSKQPGQGIGNKGVGFKSVLQISEWPEIYSAAAETTGDGVGFAGYCFTFARPEDQMVLVGGDARRAAMLADRLSPYGLPVVIEAQPPTVLELARQGFSSVIRLPLRSPDAAAQARAQLEQVVTGDAPMLLFLDRLDSMDLEVHGGGEDRLDHLSRQVKPLVPDDGSGFRLELVDVAPAGQYIVATRTVDSGRFMAAIDASIEARLLDDAWHDWHGHAEVGVAVRTDQAELVCSDRMYCYLPMGPDAHSPFPGHVNAPFAVTLSRNGLVPGTPLNDLLFAVASEAVARAVPLVKDHLHDSRSVVDLITWQGVRLQALIEAFSSSGTWLAAAPVLPLIGGGWGSLDRAYSWAHPTTVLTADLIARATGDELVDPALGPVRLQRLETLASAVDRTLDVHLNTVAEWAEAIARFVAEPARRDPSRFDPSWWSSFYDDIAMVFGRDDASALQGKAILIDDELRLRRTWVKGDEARTAIFFPMREIADEDAAARDASIPKSLRQHLAYVHQDLQWRVLNEDTKRYENRPGRDFLDRTSLVHLPRTRELLARVAQVLERRVDKQLHADALRLVYNLVIARQYNQSPELHELNLRVPTVDGRWLPAAEARFSEHWPGTLGPMLARLIKGASGLSADLTAISRDLLAQPSDFGFRLDSIDRWVEFLRRIGVRDGLWPVPVPIRTEPVYGEHWMTRLAPAAELPGPLRDEWAADIASASPRPRFPWTEYRRQGPVYRLPCSSEYEELPAAARETYGRLVADGLAQWPDAVFRVRIARPRAPAHADPVDLPSPVTSFLRGHQWVPVTRPGEPGREDFVCPRDAWHYRDEDSEPLPTFMPLVVSQVRSRFDGSTTASSRAQGLGIKTWNDASQAVDRLQALTRVFSTIGVAETLLANFRKACERTLGIIARRNATSVPPSGSAMLVTRRGRLGLLATDPTDATSDPDALLHVLIDEDRLAEAVLDALEVPVLRADPKDGRMLVGGLEPVLPGRVRMVGASDLVVLVDGEPIDEAEGALLVPRGREWLLDVLALTLEFRASAFNRQAEQRIRAATELMAAIRLHRGDMATIELSGQPVALPAHLRRVFAVADPLRPRIAFEGDPEADLDWDTLELLAPKIGEIVGAVETANAFQNVIVSLGRRLGGGALIQPSDQDYSAAFEESTERVMQVRRAQRGATVGLVYLLRPVVWTLLDGEDALGLVAEGDDAPSDPHALADILEPFDGRWRNDWKAASIVERALSSGSLTEIRDSFGLTFAAFNTALNALAPRYEPLTNPAGHDLEFATHLARERPSILARLRSSAITGFDAGEIPPWYGAAIADLARATSRYARTAGAAGPVLAPDAAWLPIMELPDELRMQEQVDQWLGAVGAIAEPAELPSVDDLREQNARTAQSVVRLAREAVPAWAAKHPHLAVALPSWIADPAIDPVRDTLARRHIFDFRPLDATGVLLWLRRVGDWPEPLPLELSLPALGLSEADLDAQRSSDAQRRWARSIELKSILLDGEPVALDPEQTDRLLAAIDGRIDERLLATTSKLQTPDEVIRSQRRKSGMGAPPPVSGSGRGLERPTSDQTSLIGFMGEFVAYRWLQRQYKIDASRWRSTNRRYAIADSDPGDDSLGYDFEVLQSRGRRLLFEVKATTGDGMAFEMPESELRVAQEHARSDRYRILFVGRVNDSEQRWLAVLPNPLSAAAHGRYRVVGHGIRYEFKLPSR